jgi:hypothetical protein
LQLVPLNIYSSLPHFMWLVLLFMLVNRNNRKRKKARLSYSVVLPLYFEVQESRFFSLQTIRFYWLKIVCLFRLARIPERLAPGLFDIWFQSHQLFHVFVVAAACVHYYGICVLSQNQTKSFGDCRNILSSNTAAMTSMIGWWFVPFFCGFIL